MLPPIPVAMLSANPKFEALHRDLCANKLNQDGTSKLDPKGAKEREAFVEELYKHRRQTAKRQIVRNGLHSLATRSSELPDELRDLVAIVAAVLGGEIAEEDRDVVEEEVEKFKENISPIAAALSTDLHQDATTLMSLLVVLDAKSVPTVSSLPLEIQGFQEDIATYDAELSASRTQIAQQVSALYDVYRDLLESSIRLLEQTMHGSLARGSKAKAEYLQTVAEGMAKKLKIQHTGLIQQVYSPELTAVLKERAEALASESLVVKRKVREAEEKLEEYAHAEGIAGMIEEFAKIMRETRKVSDEIGRLED